MLRRRRPLLRTAAVVGTAGVVAGGVSAHQQRRYAQKDQQAAEAAAYEQQYAQAYAPPQYAPAPPPTPAEPDLTTQLTKLAQLHAQGILTDDEFAAKKAELLKKLV